MVKRVPRWASSLLAAALIFVVFLAVAFGVWKLLSREKAPDVWVPADQCVATANGQSVWISLGQARLVSIIAGESIRRGLPPRAATIALATAYQESGIRNLDYGDRDSLGIFQQRPSYGWGSEAQIMDPWYSSGRFYQELVKFSGWETGDINDYAQKVQRSGHPEAYRKHETNARILASVFTGQTHAGLTCKSSNPQNPSAEPLVDLLKKVYGDKININTQTGDGVTNITVTSKDETTSWAVTALGMGLISETGIVEITNNGYTWASVPDQIPSWPVSGSAPPNSTYQTVFKLKLS